VVGVGSAILRRRLSARAGHEHHHHYGPVGHTHVPHEEEGAVTMRSLLALGVSGGLLPCPSALVVMLGAIALHRTLFGIVLVIAFSTGLAFTLTSVGLLVLYARRYLNRVPSSGRIISLMPIASAVVVSCLGVYLTMRGLQTFPDGAPRWLPALLAGAGTLLAGTLVRQALSLRRPAAPVHHHHEHDHEHHHSHTHELAGA